MPSPTRIVPAYRFTIAQCFESHPYVLRVLAVCLRLAFAGILWGLLSVGQASSLGTDSSGSFVTVQYCSSGKDRLTLDQAKWCQYVSYVDAAPSAQANAVRWVRVMAHITTLPQRLSISVGPHLVNEIEVFDGQTDKRLGGPVGLAYPYSAEHGLLVGYTFSISPETVGQHTYYIRIVTSSLPYAFVHATLDSATAKAINQQIGLGIHLGVLGLLVLVSAAVYAVTRTPIMGVFTLVILNLLLSTLAGSGLLFQYVWPEWPRFNELFFKTMFSLRSGLWLWLAQTFLAPYRTPRWYRPACKFAYAVVAVMMLSAWSNWGQVNSLLTLVFAVFVFPIGQIAAIQLTANIRRYYQRILVVGYAIGAVGMWAALLVVIYPTDNPQLPIQISRVIDYANPVVLLGLVMFHYRETILQLTATREENVAIKLGLELEQKLKEERKLMVDMLTHELKNPLASISMASGSLASSTKLSDNLTKRRLENIERSVRNMDAVIERCNVMNQLDQSTLKPNMARINLRERLSDTIDQYADGCRVKLTLNGPNETTTDPQFFQMIVSNLIDNALKYSQDGSDIQVSISRQTDMSGNRLAMKVTNQIGSKGFPDKALVFKRFYRHPLAHRTSGSGVGLYLTKALVNLMGGHITYESDGYQVIFEVLLPQATHNA